MMHQGRNSPKLILYSGISVQNTAGKNIDKFSTIFCASFLLDKSKGRQVDACLQ